MKKQVKEDIKKLNEGMNGLIKKAEKMCLGKYGVVAKISFNLQGFDVGIDEPIYYKAQASMISDIKDIIGGFSNTDIYVY